MQTHDRKVSYGLEKVGKERTITDPFGRLPTSFCRDVTLDGIVSRKSRRLLCIRVRGQCSASVPLPVGKVR